MCKQKKFLNHGIKAFGMFVFALVINSCGSYNSNNYGENDGIYFDPSTDTREVVLSSDNTRDYSEADYVYQGEDQYNNQIYSNLYSGNRYPNNYSNGGSWTPSGIPSNFYLNLGLGGFGIGYGNWMFGYNNWGIGSTYYFNPFFYNNPYYMINPYFYNGYYGWNNYYGNNYYGNNYYGEIHNDVPYYDSYGRRGTNSISVNNGGNRIQRRSATANGVPDSAVQIDLNGRNSTSPNYGRNVQNPNTQVRPNTGNVENVPVIRPRRPESNSVQPRPNSGNQVDNAPRNNSDNNNVAPRNERRSMDSNFSRPPSNNSNMSRPAPSTSNSTPERSSRR